MVGQGCWGDALANRVCCELLPQMLPPGGMQSLCFAFLDKPSAQQDTCCGPWRRAGLVVHVSDADTASVPRTCVDETVELSSAFRAATGRNFSGLSGHRRLSFGGFVAEAQLLVQRGSASHQLLYMLEFVTRLWPWALMRCAPAAWVTLLLRAEVSAFTEPPLAKGILSVLHAALGLPTIGGGSLALGTKAADAMLHAQGGLWPVVAELRKRVISLLQDPLNVLSSLDVVLPICGTKDSEFDALRRLAAEDVPALAAHNATRLFVYDLCRPFARGYASFRPFEVLPMDDADDEGRILRALGNAR